MLRDGDKGRLQAMPADQLRVVVRDLHDYYPDFPDLQEPTPDMVIDVLNARRADHASLMRPLHRETSPAGVAAIETLLGKPITRPQPKMRHAPATFNGRPPRPKPTDARIISSVTPNPKKPGSASYDRYAKYREGMTVSEAIAAGVTMADIKWDSERGFVVLT